MKPKKKKRLKLTVRIILKDILIIVAGILIFTFVFGVHVQAGNNMFPAIKDGDLIIYYRLEQLIRTDAVVYKADGKHRAGRIVAGPGDVVSISEAGELSINGGVVLEEIFYATDLPEDASVEYPFTVPDNSYFILNDFRSDTLDSRSFGSIDKANINGTSIFIVRRRGI